MSKIIIALDVETYKYNSSEDCYEPVLDAREFALGKVKTDTGIEEYFTDRNKMFQWIVDRIEMNKKRGKRTFIYGHNTEYDWYSIAQDHLLDKRMTYVIFCPFIGIFAEKGYILDTMAFYRMSLEKVGEALGMPKLEMPMKVKTLDELKPYLDRDVDITLQAILSLKERIKQLGFRPRKLLTAGQLSMTAFWTFSKRAGNLKNFTDYNVETHMRHITKSKYVNEIRHAFRGGNNTAFQIGKFRNCYALDINGLYGWSMREMEFPYLKSEKKTIQPTATELATNMNEKLGIAQCTIRAPKIAIGYLPVRHGGYTLFPTNCMIKGTWTYLELKKARELGYDILSCDWTISWTKLPSNPLKKFIEHLYEMEQKAETRAEKAPIKLLRNNLFGKFAQYKRNKLYEVVGRYEVEKWLYKGYTVCSILEDKFIIKKEADRYDPYYTNPIISALITAHARNRLYEELTKVPVEDLLYCDTDSVIFKGNHLDKFTIGTKLGEFKIEGQGDAKILGEKRYYIADNVKISGLPRRDMKKELIEEEQSVHTKRIYGLRKGLESGDLERVGGFDKFQIEMKPHCKLQIPLPRMIDETGIKMEDEIADADWGKNDVKVEEVTT